MGFVQVVTSILRPDDGDPSFTDFVPRDDFRLIVVTPSSFLPPEIKAFFGVIRLNEGNGGVGRQPWLQKASHFAIKH